MYINLLLAKIDFFVPVLVKCINENIISLLSYAKKIFASIPNDLIQVEAVTQVEL